MPPTALEMQSVIQSLKEEGKTIIFSTHIMSEAERLCDRIAIIHRGQVFASGSLSEHRQATGKHYLEDIFVHYVRDGGVPAARPIPIHSDPDSGATPPHGDPLAGAGEP